MPSQEELDAIRTALISYRDKIKDSVPDFTLGDYISCLFIVKITFINKVIDTNQLLFYLHQYYSFLHHITIFISSYIPSRQLITMCFIAEKLALSDPKLKELGESKYDQLVLWFKERLDDAIKAAEEEKTEGSGFFTDGKEEDGMCCL